MDALRVLGAAARCALIKRAGIEYAYFDLDGYGSDTVLRELKLETKQDSVPYVYVRGRFIGGLQRAR